MANAKKVIPSVISASASSAKAIRQTDSKYLIGTRTNPACPRVAELETRAWYYRIYPPGHYLGGYIDGD